ncbi:SDR family oxidoreductase [Pseudonocardia humida]|uniref:SDR family oxidoreductase n=1 Tax=Pseudonocardia humida TaxID=2800819 RepID=A0ABT0ZRX4_9PSEU|nr:SDR family oxidoreductase [Pseudonocardia humida]MCO1653470.1 SDR family oxidoreductase [Pseudonocardia humida]
MRCLVIGATGYVGARLVPRLLAEGRAVRCLVRDPAKLARLGWDDRVDARIGDLADPAAVADACSGVDAVFYLVHSMDGPAFAERDREAASGLARAARTAGVARVVYLGGLQPPGPASAHLSSRREVGEVLVAEGPPTAVLQAGIVVGAGSASFEMIRNLAGLARLGPVLPLPDRAWNRVQPIGVDDVLHHLLAALELPSGVSGTFDIGGPDVLTYRELVAGFAEEAGLGRPLSVPVPVSLPRLTARAAQALTPIGRYLAGPLLESMAHDLVCRGGPPDGPPPGGATPYREAVRRALDGVGAAGRLPTDPTEPELVEEHVERVDAPVDALWAVIEDLGGDTGWHTLPGVWPLRGALDRLVGGIGARRTRPERLRPGAALDWWRIEDVQPGRLLRLRAEMRLPGTARLELRVEPDGTGSRYVQRTTFRPDGLPGRAYWAAQLPAHRLVFAAMARGVPAAAVRRAAAARRG